MFDTAIVGGGLAGCAAAIMLARQGHSVVLLEAKAYPHHKVCGEFLSPECAALFDALEFPFAALNPVPIRSAHIIAPDGTTWETPLPDTAWGISRYTLDEALATYARQMGVSVWENAPARDIEGSLTTGFRLEVGVQASQAQTIAARTVIGAQGKRSTFDRILRRDFLQQPQPFVGLKNHFRGKALGDHIYLSSFPGGYCGMSEVENGITNVCLLVRQPQFQALGGKVPDFIAWMQQQNPHLAEWFSSASPLYEQWFSISQIPFSAKPLFEGDVLMVGDAAGLIAPLAGDGMAMALYGGRLAAQWVSGYLEHAYDSAQLRQGYSQAWRRQFQTRLRLGRLLQPLMLHPQWISRGLRLVNMFPILGQRILHHTRQEGLSDEQFSTFSPRHGSTGSTAFSG